MTLLTYSKATFMLISKSAPYTELFNTHVIVLYTLWGVHYPTETTYCSVALFVHFIILDSKIAAIIFPSTLNQLSCIR